MEETLCRRCRGSGLASTAPRDGCRPDRSYRPVRKAGSETIFAKPGSEILRVISVSESMLENVGFRGQTGKRGPRGNGAKSSVSAMRLNNGLPSILENPGSLDQAVEPQRLSEPDECRIRCQAGQNSRFRRAAGRQGLDARDATSGSCESAASFDRPQFSQMPDRLRSSGRQDHSRPSRTRVP